MYWLALRKIYRRECLRWSHYLLATLKKLYVAVDFDVNIQFLVWVAVIVLFRTLLRVSHVIDSPHTLRRRDVSFTPWGVILVVYSAKVGGKKFPRKLPLTRGPNHRWCPVFWIERLFRKFPRPSSAYLFSCEKIPVISYALFHRVFKKLCLSAGVKGRFGSHSLRRGGASFMSEVGIPLAEIKDRGMWSSSCIFDYISPSEVQSRRSDSCVAKKF